MSERVRVRSDASALPVPQADDGTTAPAVHERRTRWRTRLRAIPWLFLVSAAVAVGLIVLHTLRFPRFFFDDAFISLRYADRLRSGHGLTWTDGERVEGATNFLWVIAVAIVGIFNEGLVNSTRTLGVVSTAVGLVALMWAHRTRSASQWVRTWFPGVAVASLGPIAAWSVGGLEAPFILAGLGVSLVLAFRIVERDEFERRAAVGLGAVLSMLAFTRPDGTLFTAATCLGLVLARPRSRAVWKSAFVAGAVSSAAFAALSLFRRAWFGAWVPNTASKFGFSRQHMTLGWQYVTRDVTLWSPLLVLGGLAIVVAVFVPATRRRVSIIVPSLIVWVAYVIIIGGDFMPERRQLVPGLFLLCALAAEAVGAIAQLSGWAALAAWLIGFSACGLTAWWQRDDWAVADANNADWYWEGRPIGLFFKKAFGDKDPLLAVDAAGALPYFWGQRALDMLGLNDKYLATHPPANLDDSSVGHALGDGAYVLRRKPDIVVFHVPRGREQPLWLSGEQMVHTAEFKQDYQLLYYVTPDNHVEGVAYLRINDGKLAPVWHGAQLRLPAYVFASRKEARATLDAEGRVVVGLPAKTTLAFAHVRLPAGRCSATVDADAPLAVGIRVGSGTSTSEPGQALDVGLSRPESATVEVRTGDKPATLRGVDIRCR